ncbi:hypothetical protein C8R43DRAFT_1034004 [Mycena crocata]|nr:hypothetical protein C8R43DRAFT_1034004 [Mycena crocata]
MSSTKKPKPQGACDICRRQKGDSATMPDNRCSKCIAFNSKCTRNFPQTQEGKGMRRKRVMNPRPKTPVEQDLDTAKRFVHGLLMGTCEAPQDPEELVERLLQVCRYARSLEKQLAADESLAAVKIEPRDDDNPGLVVDIQTLPDHLKEIMPDTADHRFFGKTGSVMFLGAAIQALQLEPTGKTRRPPSKRIEFWKEASWQMCKCKEAPVTQLFPDDDLLRDLVEIYFTQVNIYFLVLHRPTFERGLADKLHLRDHHFGAVVLAVCALASKNSPDPRVLLTGEGELSAGWKWFSQIQRPFAGHVETTTLHDLQVCSLYTIFKLGINLESAWLLGGIALLHAQDIGAHKYIRSPNVLWTAEAEISTRICHHLAVLDAMCSACLGRPRAAEAVELVLPLPTACDDEYWENTTNPALPAFTQPPGQPSLAEYNIALIRLMHILRDAEAGRRTAPIDARLDQWAAEIPEHLLWNPYMADEIFFAQSASLYALYYHIQILIHRPTVQSAIGRLPSPSAFKSLAICANAARSTAHIADVRSRRGFQPHPQFLKCVFDAAVLLVLHISGGARSGLAMDPARELVDVYKCMTLLRASEQRWQNAGRFNDMICELLHASDLPLPTASAYGVPSAGAFGLNKRDAESDAAPHSFFSLPTAADDLGSLPIYDSFLTRAVPESMAIEIPAFGREILPNLDPEAFGNNLDNAVFANLNDDETNGYLSGWIPYWSSTNTLTQAMQNTYNVEGI